MNVRGDLLQPSHGTNKTALIFKTEGMAIKPAAESGKLHYE